jgi:hypothetical protein
MEAVENVETGLSPLPDAPRLRGVASTAALPASGVGPLNSDRDLVRTPLVSAGSWRFNTDDFRRGHTSQLPPATRKKKTVAFYTQQSRLIDSYLLAHARLTVRDRVAPPASETRPAASLVDETTGSSAVAPSAVGAETSAANAPAAESIADAGAGDDSANTDSAAAVRRAINITFAVNVALFAIKIFAAAYSGAGRTAAPSPHQHAPLVSHWSPPSPSRPLCRLPRRCRLGAGLFHGPALRSHHLRRILDRCSP